MRFNNFKKIAETQIPIIVFTDDSGREAIEEIGKSANLKIYFMNFNNLNTVKEGKKHPTDLPETRCMKKDTAEFMLLMHAKVEFLYKAIQANPFGSTHFAWMDFSLAYIFRQPEASLQKLKELANQTYRDEPFLAIPGCWEKGTGLAHVWNSIHWRFCGGFFLGHAKALLAFYQLYRDTFQNVIGAKQRMIWETNFWSLLEEDYNWRPQWFKADHDDSILHIPSCFLSNKKETSQTKKRDSNEYHPPSFDGGYVPPSFDGGYVPPFTWPLI